MRGRIVGLTVAGMLIAAGAANAAATFPYEGEWTLNVEKSKYPAGFPSIKDHHMDVTKDDGTILQYTDHFTVGDAPPAESSFDGTYGGKPYKTSDGQMMAVFHTKTGYRDQYTAPNGTKGKDKCDFSADVKVMTCHGQFTAPGAKAPVKFLEIWDKTK